MLHKNAVESMRQLLVKVPRSSSNTLLYFCREITFGVYGVFALYL